MIYQAIFPAITLNTAIEQFFPGGSYAIFYPIGGAGEDLRPTFQERVFLESIDFKVLGLNGHRNATSGTFRDSTTAYTRYFIGRGVLNSDDAVLQQSVFKFAGFEEPFLFSKTDFLESLPAPVAQSFLKISLGNDIKINVNNLQDAYNGTQIALFASLSVKQVTK